MLFDRDRDSLLAGEDLVHLSKCLSLPLCMLCQNVFFFSIFPMWVSLISLLFALLSSGLLNTKASPSRGFISISLHRSLKTSRSK